MGETNVWAEYTPKFCFVSELQLGKGLSLDYCTTPATCNWPEDECEEGGSSTEGSCGAACDAAGRPATSLELNVNAMKLIGADCSGSGILPFTPSTLEFNSSSFALQKNTDAFGCVTAELYNTTVGLSISGSKSHFTGCGVPASGSGNASATLNVNKIRLGEGLYIQSYADNRANSYVDGQSYDEGNIVKDNREGGVKTGTCYKALTWTDASPTAYPPDWEEITCPDPCSVEDNYVKIGATVYPNSIMGADCFGTSQILKATGTSYNTGDFCVEEGGENCNAVIRTKGWKFSGPTGALNCSSGTSGSATIEGVKEVRLGSGLYFEDYTSGICCSGNHVQINAAPSLFTIVGADCAGSDKSIAANEAQYNTGDFCIDEGSGDCDAVIRTKGWKFSGPTGALNCGSGTFGSATIEGVKEVRLGSGLYFEDYSSDPCCVGNHVQINSSSALFTIVGADCSGSR